MDALLFGLSLGFIAGISPGPLMTLVLSESLRRGFRAGAVVSLAPLISDSPVIILSLVALRQVPEGFLAVLSLAGGVLVVFLGVRTTIDARTLSENDEVAQAGSGDLLKAALVNILNPHPWLFWITVGAPFFLQTWRAAPWEAMAFLISFTGLLVGTKVVIAWAAAHGRRFMTERWYRLVIGGCGVLLVGLGLLFGARALSSWPW
jgi:threonine/homoserine/homoserine lactone efflux protein